MPVETKTLTFTVTKLTAVRNDQGFYNITSFMRDFDANQDIIVSFNNSKKVLDLGAWTLKFIVPTSPSEP